MKLVTFEVATSVGAMTRLGALLDGQQDGRIVDLTVAYAAYLAADTDEPTPRKLAALRTPPDLIGWLTGAHKSREAAEQAVTFTKSRLEHEASPTGLDGARLVYARSDIRLLAPLPRPRTIRDFSIYEEHMTQAGGSSDKRPAWYRWPPYYKGNPDSVIGPEDSVPYPNYTEKLDLEPEIAIVVGREGSNLTIEEAADYIGGYTIFMDCSCRDGHEREDPAAPDGAADPQQRPRQ